MPTSEVLIANIALARVGHTEVIADLDEASTAAATAKLFFEPTRDFVLSERRWKFAVRRASLAVAAGTAPGPWSYQYRLPSDCITALEIDRGGMAARGLDEAVTWEIESDEDGALLLTNQGDAILLYIARVEDVTKFSPPFVDALAWRLAYEIAAPLKVSRQLRAEMLMSYKLALETGSAHNANQAQPGPQPPSAYERARL